MLRIDRPHPAAHVPTTSSPPIDLLTRHKSSIALDLKVSGGLGLLLDLLRHVDILIDPFRPGTLEKLGLNPAELRNSNARLIIARLTGFRRDGKYAHMAGHDINYLAVSGVLSHLGRKDGPPYAPASLLADFAGGGLMCAFGILLALFERSRSGQGQVVENNMVDGSAYIASIIRYGIKTSLWDKPRGHNLLDGGCPCYDVYECKDGGYMAVGALEPKFFKELLHGLNLEQEIPVDPLSCSSWPKIASKFRQRFSEKSREEWEMVFDGKDACCTPVLSHTELESYDYDQRLPIGLNGSAGSSLSRDQAWESKGLSPGAGGEALLKDWLGWKRGQDYKIEHGGFIKTSPAKL